MPLFADFQSGISFLTQRHYAVISRSTESLNTCWLLKQYLIQRINFLIDYSRYTDGFLHRYAVQEMLSNQEKKASFKGKALTTETEPPCFGSVENYVGFRAH